MKVSVELEASELNSSSSYLSSSGTASGGLYASLMLALILELTNPRADRQHADWQLDTLAVS